MKTSNTAKKLLVSLLLVTLLTSVFSLTAGAEAISTDVMKATPVIDGVLDEEYKTSAVYALENLHFYTWGNKGHGDDVDATTYFLWDDNYFYVAAVVTDTDIFSLVDKELIGNPWQNDSCEFWFVDEYDVTYKINCAADGYFFLGGDGSGHTYWDFDSMLMQAKIDGDTYCVEAAMPIENCVEGRTIMFGLQVNDIIDINGSSGSASGIQATKYDERDKMANLVFVDPSTEGDGGYGETEEPTETEGKVTITPPPSTGALVTNDGSNAPDNTGVSDGELPTGAIIGIVAGVLAVVAVVAVIIVKKKK